MVVMVIALMLVMMVVMLRQWCLWGGDGVLWGDGGGSGVVMVAWCHVAAGGG